MIQPLLLMLRPPLVLPIHVLLSHHLVELALYFALRGHLALTVRALEQVLVTRFSVGPVLLLLGQDHIELLDLHGRPLLLDLLLRLVVALAVGALAAPLRRGHLLALCERLGLVVEA